MSDLVIVGLGNPGEKHKRNRHNVGFLAVDAIADAHDFGPAKKKFQGVVRSGRLGDGAVSGAVHILKPLTYMNESGQSVRALANFYKIDPAQIVVFYDELDLAPGKLKVKTGGGHAGHNGIRSIDAHLGNGFRRARIGIGHPGDKSRVSSYVLGDFANGDNAWLNPLLDAVAAAAPKLLIDDARFMTETALRLQGAARPDATDGPATSAERSSGEPAAQKETKKKTACERAPNNAFADTLKNLLTPKD